MIVNIVFSKNGSIILLLDPDLWLTTLSFLFSLSLSQMQTENELLSAIGFKKLLKYCPYEICSVDVNRAEWSDSVVAVDIGKDIKF